MSATVRSQEHLVSVGIPTYNRPKGLSRTLEAIRKQTYTNLEIIVSDNASSTGEIHDIVCDLAGRDPRVQYHRQQQNIGPSGNFQFLLGAATGKYFMWAADDDDWDASFVERCVHRFDRSDIVSVMSGVRTLYRQSGRVVHAPIPDLDPARSFTQNLAALLRRPTPALLYGLHRRDCLEFFRLETRWFDFYDCYFAFRLLGMGKIAIVSESLYTAGVDTDAYVVKQVADNRWTRLTYLQFFHASREVIAGAPLSSPEKAYLVATLMVTIARLFIHHELRHRS